MSHLLCQANALRIPLADQSAHICVTSPPYWGLRDYGVAGQLGLEPTPDEFIRTMTAVFREVWRVLRDDGTLWVNMGDSYAQTTVRQRWNTVERTDGRPEEWLKRDQEWIDNGRSTAVSGLKPKDLCGIPWRLAFALQADGWYLRSDIIWAKPNPMPESVTDRPTKSHEYLFLLSKQERYYFDCEAVREQTIWANDSRAGNGRIAYNGKRNGTDGQGQRAFVSIDPAGRNIRTVWSIPTESYAGAHFATYPRRLVEPCIKAGTSERGCCPVCGAGWVREVESERVATRPAVTTKTKGYHTSVIGNRDPQRHMRVGSTTTGWRPGCKCLGYDGTPGTPRQCVVLDPFSGSGTTGVVANALGRSYVGLDLNREYIGLAQRRIARPHAPIVRPGKTENHPLFGEPA